MDFRLKPAGHDGYGPVFQPQYKQAGGDWKDVPNTDRVNAGSAYTMIVNFAHGHGLSAADVEARMTE